MFHDHLDYLQKPSLGGGPNTKPRDHDTLNAHNHSFILLHHVWEPYMNRKSLKWHMVEGPVTHDFTLHLRIRGHTTWCWRVCWDGLWTLSFGLSHFHGHGSWLVCEKWPEVTVCGKLHAPVTTFLSSFPSVGWAFPHRKIIIMQKQASAPTHCRIPVSCLSSLPGTKICRCRHWNGSSCRFLFVKSPRWPIPIPLAKCRGGKDPFLAPPLMYVNVCN